jgi:uncharacterized protein
MAAPRPVGQPERQGLPRDDSLDLGSAVLPVLARSYWKPVVGVLAVVALVIWWITRRD